MVYHLRKKDDTGKMMIMSMRYTQIQLGIQEMFLNSDFDTYGERAFPTWITHIWEYISTRSLSIDINFDVVLPSQREGDRMIMDTLQNEFSESELQIINKVRISMKVLFLSDVVDVRGKSLLPEVYDCKIHRTTKLIWPKQVLLNKWKNVWKRACYKLQQWVSGNHLGLWKSFRFMEIF